MKSKTVSKLMLFALAIMLFGLNGCKYEEGPAFTVLTKKMRLTGEWEVVSIEGQNKFGELYLQFDKDGKFKMIYDLGIFKESAEGKWDWAEGKENIEITMDGDTEEWKVIKLTNSEFWFEDEDGTLTKCEKQ